MSDSQTPFDPAGGDDPLDQLLRRTFDQALATVDQVDLIEQVMAQILRRQRQRLFAFTLVGLVAAAICVVSGLPLLGMLGTSIAEFTQSEGLKQLPWLVLGVVVFLSAGWFQLLMEEN